MPAHVVDERDGLGGQAQSGKACRAAYDATVTKANVFSTATGGKSPAWGRGGELGLRERNGQWLMFGNSDDTLETRNQKIMRRPIRAVVGGKVLPNLDARVNPKCLTPLREFHQRRDLPLFVVAHQHFDLRLG